MFIRNHVLALCLTSSFLTSAASHVVKTKVAVLGGGMTGLIAARTLHEEGILDFVVVEARAELGGRMQDVTLGNGVRVELGPNWIHGVGESAHQNPIYTLALKNGLVNVFSDVDSLATFDDYGSVDMDQELDAFDEAWTLFLASAGERVVKQQADLTARVGFSLAGYKPRTYLDDAAEYYSFDFQYAQTPEESSFIAAAENHNFTYNDFSGEDNFVIDQRGFKTIAQAEAATFLNASDSRVLLNHTVYNISYSANGVTIETTRGVTIEAEHVICTFSVGVLQHDDVKFTPILPAWKREAIERMGMTTYTKIFLRFNSTFWSQTEYQLYADSSTRGYFPVWQSLDIPGFLPGSHVLLVTVTGHESIRIERQSDEDTQAEIMDVLRSMYGSEVPEPEEMLFKRWHSDPLFRGSYSNWGPSYPHAMLGAAVEGRLWFAGEATSYEYYGFLQGAYFEGLNVGEQVAKCLHGNCSTAPAPTSNWITKASGKTFFDEGRNQAVLI